MKCKWCESEAIKKCGRIWLCKKHYRFQNMRTKSKSDGKLVPSYEELEAMWIGSNGSCPHCHRLFNWLSKEGTATVITLQHDRSGKLNFLCLSCNARHASFDGDSFYLENKEQKICPKCLKSLPFDEFCTDNSGRWKNKKTYCRSCMTKAHAKWVEANRAECNEKRRKYYHDRKESGNPIPR